MKKLECWLNPLFLVAGAGCLIVPMMQGDFLGNAVALVTLVATAIYLVLSIIYIGWSVSKWFELCHYGASMSDTVHLVYHVTLARMWGVLNRAAYALATTLPGIKAFHTMLYHSAQVTQDHLDRTAILTQKIQDDINVAYARNNP